MLPAEVFLSHASLDHPVATRIADVLRQHGVPVFFSPVNLVGSQQWQDEILFALKRCDWFCVMLSPRAVASMWVKREVAYVLSDPRFEHRISPILLEDCDLGPLDWLKLTQRVDFRSSFDDGSRDLLRTWGIGLRPTTP